MADNLVSPNPFGYFRRDARDVGTSKVVDAGPSPEIIRNVTSIIPPPAPPSPDENWARARLQSYASMMCGGNLPVTGVGATILGADLDVANRYQVAFKNTLGRVIAVKVTANFGIAMGAADLAFSQELSNQNLVDQLSASGRVITDNILMAPEQILYIRNSDPTLIITLAGAIFRVLLLDPVSVFGEELLP